MSTLAIPAHAETRFGSHPAILDLVPKAARRTIRFAAHKYFKEVDGTSGSPARVCGKAKTGLEYPPSNYIYFGDLPKTKLAEKAEEYLRNDCKQITMFYEEVLVLAQVPGSQNFKEFTKVDKPSDFQLLKDALDSCPGVTIHVRLEWTETPSPTLDTDAAAGAAATTASVTQAPKKQRGNNSSSADAINARSGAQEDADEQKVNMAKLYEYHTLCKKCKVTKTKDALCWDSPSGQTYHLTMYEIAQWAKDMRQGAATILTPSERILRRINDAAPAARGMHAARAAAAAEGASVSGPAPAAAPTTVTGAIATNSYNHVVNLSPTPPPTRTALGDASSAANAAFPNVVQAGKAHWPIVEWARKLGDHHVALATKLFEQGIDTMRALAFTLEKGALKSLQLPQHQEAILEMWVTDWKREEKSFDDYQQQKLASAARSSVTSSYTGRPSSA